MSGVMTKSMMIVLITIIFINSASCQKVTDGIEHITSLLEDVKTSSASLLSTITASQAHTHDALVEISQSQIRIVSAFNQVVSILKKQNRQLRKIAASVNSVPSVVESSKKGNSLNIQLRETNAVIDTESPVCKNSMEESLETILNVLLMTEDLLRNALSEMSNSHKRITAIFQQVITILESHGELMQNLATPMDPVVTKVEKQNRLLGNISSILSVVKDQQTTQIQLKAPLVKDCYELASNGDYHSGVYAISLGGFQILNVYCDMTSRGGGWIVFQRRFDGSVDFYRNWNNYTQGFGSLDGEYWWGLENMKRVMQISRRSWQLAIKLTDFKNKTTYANYRMFNIGDSASSYKLGIGMYSGTAGDSLSYTVNRPFSTFDRDNDGHNTLNCAKHAQGAWWYSACSQSNLNGRYFGPKSKNVRTMYWYDWKYHQSLKATTMMMRPMQ